MPALLLLLGLGAVAAGIALSRKSVPAEVGASMADMFARYCTKGASGEWVFKPDVALGIVRTLAGQLYAYVNQSDPSRITIRPDPTGAPPSPDLSALGWARTQNGSLSIMAPVYMAESSSAQRFLKAVAPGHETSDGGQLYVVLAYPTVLSTNTSPPGVPSHPSTLPPPAVVPTPLAAANAEVPADLMALYNQLLQTGTDPNQLLLVASELDAVGMSTAAELLRKRAASLTAVAPPASNIPPPPAPPPDPSTYLQPGGSVFQPPTPTPSGNLLQTPAGPAIVVPTSNGPAAVVLSPLQKAATAMNLLLNAHGYKQADQPVYKAFQQSAGIGPDGFPGRGTMGKLQTVLGGMGVPLAPVKVYPWSSSGAYDGVNAPTQAEWSGQSTWTNQTAENTAPPAPGIANLQPSPSLPSAPPGASRVQVAAVAMNNALLTAGYRKRDQSTYKAFQSAAGLGADGFPGPGTMGKLTAALNTMGMPLAPVTIYPWRSSGAYDGVNAPPSAQWNS